MDVLFNLRLAVRFLVRHPRFAVAAVLPIAIGMGATVAAFSVVRGVLLRPLPFADPDALVAVYESNPALGVTRAPSTIDTFLDWRERSRSFQALESFSIVPVGWPFGGEDPDVQTARVTPGFFHVLGVEPVLCLQPVGARGPLISHGLWQRRFALDLAAIGRRLDLFDLTFTVSGAMPEGFDFPPGVDAWDVVPPTRPRVRDNHRDLTVVGRLRRGVSVATAQAEMEVVAQRLAEEHPESNAGWRVRVVTLQDSLVGQARPAVVAVMVVALLLLLVGCVNLASLLLARAIERRREFGIRRALGAGLGHVLSQSVAESAVVAILAAGLGIASAAGALSVFLWAGRDIIPRAGDVRVDGVVLVFSIALSAGAALLCGLAPALLEWRKSSEENLRPDAGPAGARQRSLAGLTVVEVALATILLMAASQALKAYADLRAIDVGFSPQHVSITRLWILPASPSLAARRFCPGGAPPDCDFWRLWFDELLDRVRAIPGVRHAALSEYVPLEGRGLVEKPVQVLGASLLAGTHGPDSLVVPITPDYFAVLQTRLLQGRLLRQSDRASTEQVALVNRTAAVRFWPGTMPVGHQLTIENDPAGARNVVGVVDDIRFQHPGMESRPAVYVPLTQYVRPFLALSVRSDIPATTVAAPLRRALEAGRFRPGATESLDSLLGRAVARPRFTSWTLGAFGSIALLLTASGIFSVLALIVRLRRRDMAIRLALGAGRQDVFTLILGRSFAWAFAGFVAGVAGSFGLGTSVRSLLFDTPALDPVVIAATAVTLLGAALAGAALPAWEATRSDPATVLRAD
jgi:putative ABC transport system permease protein